MPSTDHSKFSASSAKRNLTCPASYALSLALGDGTRKASVFSAEGTLAHLIAEAKLRSGVDLAHFAGMTRLVDGFEITVDEAFLRGVQEYTDYVELLMSLGYQVKLEQRVDPSWAWADWVELPLELFGTADCVAMSPDGRRLVVADLKFGKGVLVEPRNNEQLLYYAVGALGPDVIGTDYHAELEIDLVVIQPRIPHSAGLAREWTTTASSVLMWAREVLYPGVLRSVMDMGETPIPGEHCQFCPAKLGCSAPRELEFELARQRYLAVPLEDVPADPNRPDPLSPQEVVAADVNLFAAMAVSEQRLKEILDAALIVEPMIEEARKVAKERLALGAVIEGWEVVERAGKRSWQAHAPELVRELETKGFNPLPLIQMKTPAQIEENYPEVYRELRPHVSDPSPVQVLQQSRKRGPRRDPAALPPPSDAPNSIGDVSNG